MNNPVIKTIIWLVKSLLIGVFISIAFILGVAGVLYLLILIPENIGNIISIVFLTLILIFSLGIVLYALVCEIKDKYKGFKYEKFKEEEI